MLADIVSNDTGLDLGIQQTEAPRAGNIIATQIGTLEFASTFGIDLKYFLTSDFNIQTDSFKSYCVQRLLQQRVNVVSVLSEVQALFSTVIFNIGSSQNDGSLIA